MATYSPLASQVMAPAGKWSSRNGVKISRVIVHHWAGTTGGIERLVKRSDKASANYIILVDGTIIGSVPEEFRAWTSGSQAADAPSITVECQNETVGPEWRVSSATIDALTRLVADVGKRYGFTPSTATVKGHREFAATACPGPSLYPLLPQIAAAAAALNAPAPAPTPAPAPAPTPAPAPADPSGPGLVVDGWAGPATIRALQTALGTPVDGVVSSQPSVNRRYWPRAGDGWEWVARASGSTMVRALQRLTGASQDGLAGPATVRALQARLGVAQDGIAGPATITALQQRLNSGSL